MWLTMYIRQNLGERYFILKNPIEKTKVTRKGMSYFEWNFEKRRKFRKENNALVHIWSRTAVLVPAIIFWVFFLLKKSFSWIHFFGEFFTTRVFYCFFLNIYQKLYKFIKSAFNKKILLCFRTCWKKVAIVSMFDFVDFNQFMHTKTIQFSTYNFQATHIMMISNV